MTPEQTAIRQWLSKPYPVGHACCCMGPLDGNPVCPCAMAWVENVEGHWYQITEHRSPDGVTHSAEEIFAAEDPKATVKIIFFSFPYELNRDELLSIVALAQTNKIEAIKILHSLIRGQTLIGESLFTARALLNHIIEMNYSWL